MAKIKESIILIHYLRYKNKIYNYFWYRLNFNSEVAEDLTSEVFLRAIDKFETYDKKRPFQPWIFAIARNCLLNCYRTMGREIELKFAENIPNNEISGLNAGLDLETTIAEIKCLDKYCQEVLLLRYVDGLSNTEIAIVLERDEGAIRTQISRARKKLQENFNIYDENREKTKKPTEKKAGSSGHRPDFLSLDQ